MEFVISHIDFNATKFQVQKAIEDVLHGPDLYDPEDPKNKGRVPNFIVQLTSSDIGRLHNGSGFLTLPSSDLATRFERWFRDPANKRTGIRVLNRKMYFQRSPRKIYAQKRQIMENAMYIGPEQEEKRESILAETAEQLRVARVQFGVWYRPPTPKGGAVPDRIFSVEYERDYSESSAAYLEVNYDHKCIRIELGERHSDDMGKYVVVKYTSIKKMGIGFDFGHPFIVFDMYVPPVFEEKNFNDAPRDGYQRRKNKDRDRIMALDDRHAWVAPYSPHLRILLFRRDDLLAFEHLCRVAECEPRPIRVPTIEAEKSDFFSRKNLNRLQGWMRGMDWKNAFQIEAYLRSNLLTMTELLGEMRPSIEDVIERYGPNASEILRLFNVELQLRKPGEHPRLCLERVIEKNASPAPLRMHPGWFLCHHITFTPTRVLLEGPYAAASNRIIRRYQKEHAPGLLDNFVRVDFRDEDRLSYRWDRQVDGTYFLHNRVGRTLKDGFELGGKHFEFLAYSNSALKSHAVWFMSPFTDPNEGYVTADRIRRSIGDFGELWTQPSKLAARIAQAFTATDPSITLVKGQWEEMDDVETVWTNRKGEEVEACHTDGVGTIWMELRDMIWGMLCEASNNGWRHNRATPSAFQIRFLGYKGVVVVDERLEGVLMRLRPSQRKFKSHMVESASIEIARAFDYPNNVYLNKPVIMALEDRGVDKEEFIELQEIAKRDVYTAQDSLANFARHLRGYNSGGKFHLAFIVECLELFGLDLTANYDKRPVGSELFARLLRYAMNDTLRTMKHRARIPVPGSYQLVGVADEGQAYINEGEDPGNVFTLGENQIFVCVQETAESEPIYLKGKCVISRSPVVHPGDVMNVFAVGKPPANKKCFFRNLRNVVVLPVGKKHGDRSMASCLGGGDLDGDTYDIYYKQPGLNPTTHIAAAEYPSVKARTLPDGQTATIEDICDFIVEYINSDVLGLLADRHLTLADQSKEGTSDPGCMKLAELCSLAVDYQKHGNPIDIDNDNLPHLLMRYKPDWHKAEVADPRDNDYYESPRALGHLYRGIELLPLDAPVPIPVTKDCPPMGDSISIALAPTLQRLLLEVSDDVGVTGPPWTLDDVVPLFARYARELRYIRATHTLADMPGVRLAEEEVILGAILSTCTQARWRADRVYRLRLHAEALVSDTRRRLLGEADEIAPEPAALRVGLAHSWTAWEWAQRNAKSEGAQSFGLLVLGALFDCLKKLDALPVRPQTPEDDSDAEDDDW